jgi:hypothetical protein
MASASRAGGRLDKTALAAISECPCGIRWAPLEWLFLLKLMLAGHSQGAIMGTLWAHCRLPFDRFGAAAATENEWNRGAGEARSEATRGGLHQVKRFHLQSQVFKNHRPPSRWEQSPWRVPLCILLNIRSGCEPELSQAPSSDSSEATTVV